MKRFLLHVSVLLACVNAAATEADSSRVSEVASQSAAFVESSVTASSGDFAPLWLTSNRYGLGSVEPYSNYERAAIGRDIGFDEGRRWGFGYALGGAVAVQVVVAEEHAAGHGAGD